MQHACTGAEGARTDERRRSIKSHEWRLSDAAGGCVGACALQVPNVPNEPVYAICRCSMRVQVRRAHVRQAAQWKQIARMAPQRRRFGLCGCTHAAQRPCICRLSMRSMRVQVRRAHARRASGAVQSNRTNGASATPLGPVWVSPRYPTTEYMSSVDAACVYKCEGPTHDERRRAIKSHEWPQRRRWGLCGCLHATQRPCICRLSISQT
jgi:hypothetical protein